MEPMTMMALASMAAPVVENMFGKKTTSQQLMRSPEQAAAASGLLAFMQDGRFGNFKVGEDIGIQGGDYGMTGYEGQGLSALSDMLMEGIPDQYRIGDAALNDYLQTDPRNVDAQFAPFKEGVERITKESEANFKRGASMAGNLYSTDTIKGLGDINARSNQTLTSELARLTDKALDRRLAAVPLAYQSAESKQGAQLKNIAASQSYGSLTRNLNDAAVKARDAELLRRREELKMPLEAAGTLYGTGGSFGVPSVQTSPYGELLNMAGKLGGTYVGNEMFKRQFPGQKPALPAPRYFDE